MLILYDRLNQESLDLAYSLQAAEIGGVSVVLQDDGFLPDGFTSPFAFFAGQSEETASPLYFNQVPVPKYWQITGTNQQGEIWNYGQKKATIYYQEPKHLRLVKTVEWLNDQGRVMVADHYNRWGRLFAKTYFNEELEVTHKQYFDADQRPYLMENLVTGDLLLEWQGQVYPFAKKIDFYLFYLRQSGLDLSQIAYNSLGMPFLLAYYLGGEGSDLLFWQEDLQDQIPGNMQLLFQGNLSRTTRIVVQKETAYQNLLALLAEDQKASLAQLGYIYPSHGENGNGREILVLTNSDQLEGLDTLLEHLPDYRFHIAALTEMSPKLMDYGQRSQVHLYPNAGPSQIQGLLQACDIYLDINHGSEIMAALRQAFEHNLLLAAFDTTCHQPALILPEALFDSREPATLATWLKEQPDLAVVAQKQRQLGGQATVADYQALLKG
ncbi:accessory Sec system glycosylation chaperone GtfB [Streptococcus danieliae]|uniref:UDP-N-acetylglucosamine--peptide N-acetylglucosaminyltransferase stabilizing protein GtfB n=1 Tax=Streptococcus danieliae TaxID=747656 RepID=A0A7Z0S4Z4_9STRE|nr:accessory Sec system glycosylation chaperone GtfB [Streptococcus danieliae]MBF0699740.1 accessory Sec system glycosylation chaperone GtfB [Streptococcus danieliae]NYS96916.1 accessory Sec system glycosylation chaperone GtfB [Streptococcus danieliae]